MADYRRLKAWQAAYRLALDVYRVTNDYPSVERYGLVAQSRRAAVSVAANIAEGAGRGGGGDFTRFLWIARGSLAELATEIALARDLGMLPADVAESLTSDLDETGRILMGLLKSREAVPRRDVGFEVLSRES